MEMNSRIRQYIENNGLKFTFVAEKSGIDIKKFSRLMNNKQKMTIDEYEIICSKGLSVDPSIFFKKKFLETKNSA